MMNPRDPRLEKKLSPQDREKYKISDKNLEKFQAHEQEVKRFTRNLKDETGKTYEGKLGRVSDPTDDPDGDKRLLEMLKPIIDSEDIHRLQSMPSAKEKSDYKQAILYDIRRGSIASDSDSATLVDEDMVEITDTSSRRRRESRAASLSGETMFDNDTAIPTDKSYSDESQILSRNLDALNLQVNGQEIQNRRRLNSQERTELTNILRRTVPIFKMGEKLDLQEQELPKPVKDLLKYMNDDLDDKAIPIDGYNKAVKQLEKILEQKQQLYDRVARWQQDMNEQYEQMNEKQKKENKERSNGRNDEQLRVNDEQSSYLTQEPLDKVSIEQQRRTSDPGEIVRE